MITLSKLNKTSSQPSELKPQLTSLVDAMTLIVIFLIKSFSVEGNLITPSENLQLPISSSENTPRPLNSIKITKEYLLSDDAIITKISSFSGSDSMLIPELNAWLINAAVQGSSSSNELMIQSDKDISFDIIKKVMYTCSQAGKTDFTILVVREG